MADCACGQDPNAYPLPDRSLIGHDECRSSSTPRKVPSSGGSCWVCRGDILVGVLVDLDHAIGRQPPR
jgi:hypothetical protein